MFLTLFSGYIYRSLYLSSFRLDNFFGCPPSAQCAGHGALRTRTYGNKEGGEKKRKETVKEESREKKGQEKDEAQK